MSNPLLPFLIAAYGGLIDKSESDVAAMIDRSYPKLQAARTEIEAARARLKNKRGAFDPVFSFDSTKIRYNSSSYRGKTYETDMTEAVIEATDRTGVTYFAGTRRNFGEVKSPDSSTGSLGEYYVGLKLPLLRKNGLNDKSVAERQAQIGVDIAELDVSLFRLGALRGGLNTYWNWVASTKKREIAAKLLELAVTRAAQIRRRVDKEDLPAIEATEADTEVKRREGDLARADRAVQAAFNSLSLYLWAPENKPSADVPLPVPPEALMNDVDRAQWESRAVQQRPEIKGLALSKTATELTLALARNDRRPALDLIVSPGVDTGKKSIGGTSKLGLIYSIPLRQNTVDGRIEEAEQKLKKIDIDRSFAEGQIRIDVRDALNALDTVLQRYDAVKAEVDLAERLERGERIRYEQGDGTLFLLIQRERATAEARARMIDVLADYQQARIALRAAAADL